MLETTLDTRIDATKTPPASSLFFARPSRYGCPCEWREGNLRVATVLSPAHAAGAPSTHARNAPNNATKSAN